MGEGRLYHMQWKKRARLGLVWFLAVSRGLGDLSSPTKD